MFLTGTFSFYKYLKVNLFIIINETIYKKTTYNKLNEKYHIFKANDEKYEIELEDIVEQLYMQFALK